MATEDILSHLKVGFDEYKGLTDKFYYKTSLQKIAVTPRWWSSYGSELESVVFDWKDIKYTDLDGHLSGDSNNGDGIGVYLFVVKPDFSIINLPGYVFYVGIAGERDSERHLRDRLRQYIQVSSISKRNKVQTALELYHHETYVFYSKLNVSSVELSEIESNLHGYFMPWANERDYPAPVKRARGAW
ncbi:hypothetical protein [Enterovibrio norvegicus]|uniref:hypothetical protein n=1 Tax=Enterovibrio norvegicus TaxID=188144 RepID=UPI000C815169|nr:hypothetical protein [Enterovibrio norvegicus]PMI30888.1 hypothetical protein BCU47_16770 [Enterovibrio norvegicus]